jgi:hypothetical protein
LRTPTPDELRQFVGNLVHRRITATGQWAQRAGLISGLLGEANRLVERVADRLGSLPGPGEGGPVNS